MSWDYCESEGCEQRATDYWEDGSKFCPYHADTGELRAENEHLRVLLSQCYRAIYWACFVEDGLDASEGGPLLDQIRALLPDLPPPDREPAQSRQEEQE